MKLKALTGIALAGLLASQTAQAQDVAIAAKVSSLGLGAELSTNIIPLFANIRLQANGFNYSKSFTDPTNSTLVHNAKVKLRTVGLIADVYPFAGKFRLSVGAYYNNNQFSSVATPKSSITIGGTTYTPAQIGTVDTQVRFNKFAPYVGMGWGDAVSSGSPIGFSLEVGALLQGTPKTTMTATSNLVDPADLIAQQQTMSDYLKKFKVYPVVGLGVNFKF